MIIRACVAAMFLCMLPFVKASAQTASQATPQALWPNQREGDFILKDYRFASGETMAELKLHYTTLGTEFAAHNTVNHRSKEYVRGTVHTNTIENVWSVFKRGMKGVYQHCGEAHLHRYLAEFDFRYNNRAALKISDRERTGKIMEGIECKRLTYRRISEAKNA